MMWRNKKLFADEVDSNLPKKRCPRKKGEEMKVKMAVWGVLTSVGQSNYSLAAPDPKKWVWETQYKTYISLECNSMT